MLCQKCNEGQATVHFVKVINGVRAEMHLCENATAGAKGDSSYSLTLPSAISTAGGNAICLPQMRLLQ